MLKSPFRWLPLLLLFLCGAQAARVSKSSANAGPRPEVVGFWRFEHDVKPEGRNPAVGPAKRVGGVYFYNDDVPGPFIYDPLQKLSYPNSASLSFQSDDKHNEALEVALNVAKANLAGQSVTLELFVKPNAEWDGPLAMKARFSDAAAEWGLGARRLEEQNQTFLQAFFTPPGGKKLQFQAGHEGSSAQVRNKSGDWRHMAFVYDAAAKTLTCYVDYYLAKTVGLPGEMKWDAGSLFIGGGPGKSTFGGRIDEVRLTKAALRPSQFLRARREPLTGVSFESTETLLPRGCGYIDLKECFGALGDGKNDDTPAFREAFRLLSNQAPSEHHTLYIPPGTYLVGETLASGRSLSVLGAGPEKTVIKLRDKCPGFTSAAEVRAMWQVDNMEVPVAGDPDLVDRAGEIAISHLTIDTGKGNVGAKGMEVHSRLFRRLEDVQIRSGDGSGLIGLELAPKTEGAGLFTNVRIKGFDYGVLSSGADSTMTFEQIGLEGQRLSGFKQTGGVLAIRQLTSVNQVPALMSIGAACMATLLDSTLKGGGKEAEAVQSEGGLCVLRVETAGYGVAIRKRERVDSADTEWKESVIAGPKVDEFIGDRIVSGQGAPTTALKLPIENTPDVPWGDIHTDWVSVLKFADKKAGDDWMPAVQAAIDSGAKTIFFPPGTYALSGAVHVRGKIERLFGLQSHLARSGGLSPEESVVLFDEPGAKRVVVIDGLEIDGLRNASPATLVLKNSWPGHYDNAAGCGKLFLENVEGAEFMFSQAQSVWARQWNSERHGIFGHGTNLWCLGLCAGSESSALFTEAGASTEIFGAMIRPVESMSENRPFFGNTNSRLSISYAIKATDPPHDLQIVDTQAGAAKKITAESLKWIGDRGRMDLFRSDAAAAAAGN